MMAHLKTVYIQTPKIMATGSFKIQDISLEVDFCDALWKFFFEFFSYFEEVEDDKDEFIDMNVLHPFSTLDLIHWLQQIAEGMDFLTSNNIVHRDLAARNILLCDGNLVKISDFGLSKDVHKYNLCEYYKVSRNYLPFRWMAPESLSKKAKFSAASDVWSFGKSFEPIFMLKFYVSQSSSRCGYVGTFHIRR